MIVTHRATSGGKSSARGFQVSFISSMSSRPPFTAFLNGLDLNGDGSLNDLLPGSKTNGFNRGIGKADLQRLVAAFNQNVAGGRTPGGAAIPRITLPANYEFGDNFLSQDLRLTKQFQVRERYRFSILGEAFNLFNIANLSGFSGDLRNTAAFGQPASRVMQVFGSGGPRAFQLGARISF
jgi:hypothetical protein